MSQELAAIKARVQELEMEEETERLKEEEERCDGSEMHLLTSSPRPGEAASQGLNTTARPSPSLSLPCHVGVQINTDNAYGKPQRCIFSQVCSIAAPPGR